MTNPWEMSLLIISVLLFGTTLVFAEVARRQSILLREATEQYHNHMRTCDKEYGCE